MTEAVLLNKMGGRSIRPFISGARCANSFNSKMSADMLHKYKVNHHGGLPRRL